MPDRGEVYMDDQRHREDEDQYRQVAPPPRLGDVVGQHRHRCDHEVADPDIAGTHQLLGLQVMLDGQVQQPFADIRRADVRRQTHSQPTQLAEPAFGRREKQGKQHQVRRPVAAVDPQQAGEEHFQGIAAQVVEVGRAVHEHGVQLTPGQMVLDDRGDQQNGQP